MKGRVFWVFVLAVALVLVAVWLRRNQTRSAPLSPAEKTAIASPAGSAKPKADVAIEDGKTIDFSSGAPVVKDNAKEKAAIDRAVKEMEDATKNVTFGASAPAPDDKKKAEPPVAPPKT